MLPVEGEVGAEDLLSRNVENTPISPAPAVVPETESMSESDTIHALLEDAPTETYAGD